MTAANARNARTAWISCTVSKNLKRIRSKAPIAAELKKTPMTVTEMREGGGETRRDREVLGEGGGERCRERGRARRSSGSGGRRRRRGGGRGSTAPPPPRSATPFPPAGRCGACLAWPPELDRCRFLLGPVAMKEEKGPTTVPATIFFSLSSDPSRSREQTILTVLWPKFINYLF